MKRKASDFKAAKERALKSLLDMKRAGELEQMARQMAFDDADDVDGVPGGSESEVIGSQVKRPFCWEMGVGKALGVGEGGLDWKQGAVFDRF